MTKNKAREGSCGVPVTISVPSGHRCEGGVPDGAAVQCEHSAGIS